MSNISFDNPIFLAAGIPLLLVVLLPFFFSVRKSNRNIHNVLSFICHLLLVVTATLGAAGMVYDAMITETNVYVLADVSYSSQNHLDILDGYVHDVEQALPDNSKMGLIAFGRNYQMLSDLGEEIVSVRNADAVETDATDIAGVLRYAGNLFDDDVIKHIVLITDGAETIGGDKLDAIVGKLNDEGIYIDVIFLNNTISEEVRELQMTDVAYTASAFVGREETAELTVNSNNAEQTHVYIDVTCDGKTESYVQTLYKGQNLLSVPLRTETAGEFAYTISVRPENAEDDTSYYNNSCLITQTVNEKVNVLYLGGSLEDCAAGQKIYGTENVRYLTNPDEIPFTVEDLCMYDEIVLCNFDVRTMLSCQQFVSSLDTLISKFGKTLTTYGNTFVQEAAVEPNQTLSNLSGLLPVTVGNPDQDTRLVVLLMDISISMNFSSRWDVAHAAIEKLIESLNENDMVMVIGYAGDYCIMHPAKYLKDKPEVLEHISDYEPRNGTVLKDAMTYAYEQISMQRFHHRELILISDGLFYADTEEECIALAEEMSEQNIVISAIGITPANQDAGPFMRNLVENKNANGKGYYKAIQTENDLDYVMDSVAEQMAEVRIEGSNYVLTLRRPQEAVLSGVASLPAVQGFWYSANKTGATSVITAKYYRDKVYSLDVPIYSYWNYGNGKVASFLSDITGDWTQTWRSENEERFLTNIRASQLPKQQIDLPFLVTFDTKENRTHISVTTASFRNESVLTVTMTDPDGEMQTKTLFFDSENYVAVFDTDQVGRYTFHLVYDYATLHYETDVAYAISYYPEYDSFTTYTVASLYRLISDNGEVSQDGKLKMDHSDSATRSYHFSFTVPLMIACIALFVLDVVIRLIRWRDIRSLFVHKRKQLDKQQKKAMKQMQQKKHEQP